MGRQTLDNSSRTVGSRTRSGKFVKTAASCHFLMFDGAIDRIKRIEFYLAANATLENVPQPQVERYAELRLITDPRHPAVGSYGLFAKTRIASQTVITPYSGCVQHAQNAPLPGTETYGMGYMSHPDLVVDAEFMGNYARFANDPRNTIKTANIIAQNKVTRFGENVTVLVAKSNISAGEELLLDYGKGHLCVPKVWEDRWGVQVTRTRRPSLPFPGDQMSVLWQCTQCGGFSGTTPLPACANVCSRCNQPRASHAPMVSVYHDPKPKKGGGRGAMAGEKRKRSSNEAEVVDNATTSGDETSPTRVAMAQEPQTLQPGSDSLAAKWPMNFPYISWQIWDPEVPLSMVLDLAVFKQQEKISVCEKQDEERSIAVFNTEAVKDGDEIAVGGGLVVLDGDARLSLLSEGDENERNIVETQNGPHKLSTSMVVPVRGLPANDDGGADTDDELGQMRFHVIVTNELRHLSWEKQSEMTAAEEGENRPLLPAVKGNCVWATRIDAMGCVYLALVAKGELKPWQELAVARN